MTPELAAILAARVAGRAELARVALDLDAEELAVLTFIARRLLDGQRRYGPLDLKHDPRDFEQERAEEIGDLLAYSAFAELQRHLRERGRGERQASERAPSERASAEARRPSLPGVRRDLRSAPL